MKNNLFLVLCIALASCNSSKEIYFQKEIKQTANNCLKNGYCKTTLLPNKSISFKKDAAEITHPVISKGNKTIFKYTFTKQNKKIQDSFYSEIIYAELNSTITEINLKNEQLEKIKLHFGRLCFCKGQTGYYPITKGYFKLKKINHNTIKIEINFKNEKVPQLIQTINETIFIK